MVDRHSSPPIPHSGRVLSIPRNTENSTRMRNRRRSCGYFYYQGLCAKSSFVDCIQLGSKVWSLFERGLTNVNYTGCWAHTPKEYFLSFVCLEIIF